MQKLLIIVPVFNEEGSISNLIGELQNIIKKPPSGFLFDFVIVNDASTDKTECILGEISCNQIHLPTNLGIGGAVQTGYKYAKLLNYDFALQIDGDGQHCVQEIERLIKHIKITFE